MAPIAIAPGALHVWEADLRGVPEELLALLDPEERARAEAIIPAAPRRHWPRSRALLRLLLAGYSGQAPDQLALLRGRNGKPLLAGGAELQFNLSHSGPIALYAFTAAGPVGIDVEQSGRRPEAFLRRWTRHEAALKCCVPAPWLCELDLGRRALGALACAREPAAVERFSWTAPAG